MVRQVTAAAALVGWENPNGEHVVDAVYRTLDACRETYISGDNMPIKFPSGTADLDRYYIEVDGLRFGWVFRRSAGAWDSYLVETEARGTRVAHGAKTRREAAEDVVLAARANRYAVAHVIAKRVASDRRYAELMAELEG
jgi:hypothetical protein